MDENEKIVIIIGLVLIGMLIIVGFLLFYPISNIKDLTNIFLN
jgi:hypothetical protein